VPNFFSSDPFFEVVAKAFYPGRRWQAEYVEAGGSVYRVLVVGKTIVDELWAQPFFYEPVADGIAPARRQIRYLPRVSYGQVPWHEAAAHGAAGEYRPAPFVDWSQFASWEEYERRVLRARPLALSRRTTERRRSLARNLGPLEFRFHDDDPEALALGLRWKSAQLRATGLPDWFADPRTRQLYDEFARMGLLAVSTLRAGSKLVAMLGGTLWDGRFYDRLGSYDATSAVYSPGRLLYFEVLEWCYRNGHREFDFLMGGEEYKFGFATHARLIAPVGTRPRSRAAVDKARAMVGTPLLRWPPAMAGARKVESVVRGRHRGG